MPRLTLVSIFLLGLTSCDCEPGPTGPHAFVQNHIITEGTRHPDSTSLTRFESSLKHLSFEEIIELTDLIHQAPSNRVQTTKASEVLAQEAWSRNPDLLEFHRLLGGYGEDDQFNRLFVKRIALTDPEASWKIMKAYYIALFRAENHLDSRGAALPFFVSLQSHHPGLARRYFLPLAFEPKYETGQLKSEALSGIFAGMTKAKEARSFIKWIRREKIDQCMVGMYSPHQSHPFLKINPNDRDLQCIAAISLTVLTELSPPEAEAWILQNQKSNSLPQAWANAYLIGLQRKHPDLTGAGLEFIARISPPTDGVLEDLFEKSRYIHVPPAGQQRLLKIRAEANG